MNLEDNDVTITVTNWKPSRHDNPLIAEKDYRVHFNPDFAFLCATDLYVWDYLVALAHVKGSASFKFDASCMADQSRTEFDEFYHAVVKLLNINLIKLEGPDLDSVLKTLEQQSQIKPRVPQQGRKSSPVTHLRS